MPNTTKIFYYISKNWRSSLVSIVLTLVILFIFLFPGLGNGPSVYISDVKDPVASVDSLVNMIPKSEGVNTEIARLNYLIDSIDQSGSLPDESLQELTLELERVVEKLEGSTLVERRLLNELRAESDRLHSKLSLAEKSPWGWPSSRFLTAFASLLTAITIFGVFVVLAFDTGGIWETIGNTLREAERVELFGNTFILDSETRSSGKEVFNNYSQQRKDLFREEVGAHSLNERFAYFHSEYLVPAINSSCEDDIDISGRERSTIHIRDILLSHTLYQLIDYKGNAASRRRDNGKANRSFTIRNGIIGRAWRCDRSFVAGPLANNPYILRRDYGYTSDETDSMTDRKSLFLGHVIRSEQNPDPRDEEDDRLGILFLDVEAREDTDSEVFEQIQNKLVQEIDPDTNPAPDGDEEIQEGEERKLICYSNCEGRTSGLASKINNGLWEMGIPQVLSSIESELSPRAPRIDVHSTY